MLLKVETYHDGDSWCARVTSEDIFTQAETYDELLHNIREASMLHFDDEIRKGKTIEILVMSEMELNGVAEAAAGFRGGCRVN